MNYTVVFDWKFVVALGAAISGIILSTKVGSDAAERVSALAVGAYKECLITENSIQ